MSHLSESFLYAWVHGQLNGADAFAVADHLSGCLVCRVWASRLQEGHLSEPDDATISRLITASPTLPETLRRAVAADGPTGQPETGEVWQAAGREGLLVWVRAVFDDSAAVVPITFDSELADEYSLIIPSIESPLEVELVLMASVESEIALSAFRRRIGTLPAHDRISDLRRARRHGQPPSEGLRVGAPIVSDQDQRIEYRHLISDILAGMSVSNLEAIEAEAEDDGLDVHHFTETLRELVWRRNDVTIRTVGPDLIELDETLKLLPLAEVEHLDVVVPVAVLIAAEVPPLGKLAAACEALLKKRPDANAAAVSLQNAEWTTVLADRPHANTAYEAPSGEVSPPRVTVQPLRLVDALLKYLDANATRWHEIEPLSLPRGSLEVVGLSTNASLRAIDTVVAGGARARIPAKKEAFASLGRREEGWIREFIDAIVMRGHDHRQAFEQFIDRSNR